MDLSVVEFILCVINTILHSSGVGLIHSLERKRSINDDVTQMILVINLSISELIISAVEIVQLLFEWFCGEGKMISDILTAIELTGITWPFFLFMIMITVDRFFHFYLNLHYKNFFNKQRVVKMCWMVWMTSLGGCSIMVSVYYIYRFDYKLIYYSYLFPLIEGFFVLCASFTYGYIIWVFKKNQRNNLSTRQRSSSISKIRVTNKRRKPKLYIPTLLILSFVSFVIIPDVTFMIILNNKKMTRKVEVTIWIMFMVSFLSDGIIYVFMQKTVRDEFWKVSMNLCQRLYCVRNSYRNRRSSSAAAFICSIRFRTVSQSIETVQKGCAEGKQSCRQ